MKEEMKKKILEIEEWANNERRKLDEKYIGEKGLDGHNSEYKAIITEQIRRMQELKKQER